MKFINSAHVFFFHFSGNFLRGIKTHPSHSSKSEAEPERWKPRPDLGIVVVSICTHHHWQRPSCPMRCLMHASGAVWTSQLPCLIWTCSSTDQTSPAIWHSWRVLEKKVQHIAIQEANQQPQEAIFFSGKIVGRWQVSPPDPPILSVPGPMPHFIGHRKARANPTGCEGLPWCIVSRATLMRHVT